MKTQPAPQETELDALNWVLADLRTIRFRARQHTLDEADFETLVQRSRDRLKRMRDARMSEELAAETVELNDAGEAVAMALSAGHSFGIEMLLQHHPELMTGAELADRLSGGVTRARTYREAGRPTLVVVDGERA